jgi:Mn2+/Fe2+ NRAMP family transporter
MHLLGQLVLLHAAVVGVGVVYTANYLILRMLYGRPNFPSSGWRQRLLWGVGLIVPVAGIVILVLTTVVVILVFAVVFLMIGAMARRSNPT